MLKRGPNRALYYERKKKKYNEHNLADKRDGLLMTDKSLKF